MMKHALQVPFNSIIKPDLLRGNHHSAGYDIQSKQLTWQTSLGSSNDDSFYGIPKLIFTTCWRHVSQYTQQHWQKWPHSRCSDT
jgi:hypothetical protein